MSRVVGALNAIDVGMLCQSTSGVEIQLDPGQLRYIIKVQRHARGLRQRSVVIDQLCLRRGSHIGSEDYHSIDVQVVQELNAVQCSAQAGIPGSDKQLSASRAELD